MYFPGMKAFVQGEIPMLDGEVPAANGCLHRTGAGAGLRCDRQRRLDRRNTAPVARTGERADRQAQPAARPQPFPSAGLAHGLSRIPSAGLAHGLSRAAHPWCVAGIRSRRFGRIDRVGRPGQRNSVQLCAQPLADPHDLRPGHVHRVGRSAAARRGRGPKVQLSRHAQPRAPTVASHGSSLMRCGGSSCGSSVRNPTAAAAPCTRCCGGWRRARSARHAGTASRACLADRSWTCPACRAVHDRDHNTVKVILADGRAERLTERLNASHISGQDRASGPGGARLRPQPVAAMGAKAGSNPISGQPPGNPRHTWRPARQLWHPR